MKIVNLVEDAGNGFRLVCQSINERFPLTFREVCASPQWCKDPATLVIFSGLILYAFHFRINIYCEEMITIN